MNQVTANHSGELRKHGDECPIPLHPENTILAPEYTFEPSFLKTDSGFWMHFVDRGEGSPVLMVHGNPTWSYMYRNLIRGLESSHRCIVPDHIGCGRSQKPQDFPYLLENHIDNLEKLILTLDLRDITLVVHDWGGAIGVGTALRHPQRFRSLVAFNTSAFWMPRIPQRINICRAPIFGEIAIRGCNGFALGALAMATAKPFSMPLEVMRGFVAPYDSWANRIATLAFVRDIPMYAGHPSLSTLRNVEEGVRVFSEKPSLVLWGMRDFCFDPTFLEEWARRLGPDRIIRFPDAGHYLLEDAREEAIGAIVDFIG
ncbi:MAG: alpha/beta hydrolase [Candidatus Wallbacteria bacterium HGW-Wallbacteria-1]|jgi:haloalkane dehalogenase|uniref:Alpha/beta hydrolase n=1 Tax=Candidatus Wallbacteria bacterium HGW-Wallbacteria-1 TaxID=2013854 RepID=A0A2N1PUG2_9BACT|nr:MAG: alpha/beta hydrolase [Candidatus Wallbacteria bacterium HGW-Wallbacteria-1]